MMEMETLKKHIIFNKMSKEMSKAFPFLVKKYIDKSNKKEYTVK